MNINKKLDRVKQWAGEKVGQSSKTGVSDEFKSLEMEMTLRHEGMHFILQNNPSRDMLTESTQAWNASTNQ
jgi:hypothetical protein